MSSGHVEATRPHIKQAAECVKARRVPSIPELVSQKSNAILDDANARNILTSEVWWQWVVISVYFCFAFVADGRTLTCANVFGPKQEHNTQPREKYISVNIISIVKHGDMEMFRHARLDGLLSK